MAEEQLEMFDQIAVTTRKLVVARAEFTRMHDQFLREAVEGGDFDRAMELSRRAHEQWEAWRERAEELISLLRAKRDAEAQPASAQGRGEDAADLSWVDEADAAASRNGIEY